MLGVCIKNAHGKHRMVKRTLTNKKPIKKSQGGGWEGNLWYSKGIFENLIKEHNF
jgi:hypothetical protein